MTLLIITVLISGLLLGGLVLLAGKEANKETLPLEGNSIPVESLRHVAMENVKKTQDPQTSGDHFGGGVAGPGIHDEPVEDGLIIHSLEHGAVVVHYDPNQLDENEVGELKDFFRTELRGKKILLPRPNMTTPIIMTSWGQILSLESLDKEKMVLFMAANNDRGPERVGSY